MVVFLFMIVVVFVIIRLLVIIVYVVVFSPWSALISLTRGVELRVEIFPVHVSCFVSTKRLLIVFPNSRTELSISSFDQLLCSLVGQPFF